VVGISRATVTRAAGLGLSLVAVAALAGCAGGGATGGPGAKLAGNQCTNLRAELNKMDSRGVPSLIEAKSAGKKMSAQQDGDISRYNSLLEQYLKGQCQV